MKQLYYDHLFEVTVYSLPHRAWHLSIQIRKISNLDFSTILWKTLS